MSTTTPDPYPSRGKVDEPRLIERSHPVVLGTAEDGPLTREQLDAFDRDGFLQVDGLFSADEAHALLQELQRLQGEDSVREAEGTISDPDTGDVRSVFAIQDHSDLMDKVIHDERTAGAARQILASEVYLHHTRVNDKPGFGGSGFNWHSDFETWHTEDGMPTPRCLSASILLTHNHSQNGPLLLIPGSHRTFVACVGATPEQNWVTSLKNQEAGIPDEDLIAQLHEEHGLHVATGEPGTVIFFDSNTLHASNGNVTKDRRANVFAVYNSVENTVEDPFEAPMARPAFLSNRDFTPIEIM